MGDPATQIVRSAAGAHADLIVIGTHGRGGIGRLMLGSVADKVIRKADRPVLVVPSKPPSRKAPPRRKGKAT